MSKHFKLLIFTLAISFTALCQDIYIDVNLNVEHKIDTFSTFDRAKYVTIHADLGDSEWGGNNVMGDLMKDFLEGYDVYLGRSTGGVQWYLNNNTTEDPSRSGYANPASITSNGNNIKSSYAAKTGLHKYEYRDEQILCNQQFPFFPGSGIKTAKGWGFTYSDTPEAPFGTASGEFYGRFIRDSYGTGGTTGAKKPKYIEIMNEPLWKLADFPAEYEGDGPLPHMDTIWLFHKSVAKEVKKYNANSLVGGFVCAFPDLEKSNFQHWDDRWKSFMDIAGAEMDFWAIHLYDMPSLGGKEIYRKGSNVEATLDMIEQYSVMKFGYAKPFLVSEIGAYDHAGMGKAWSPYHDWVDMKSINSLLMQFMERPDKMLKIINYVMLKAKWAETNPNDPTNIWGARLLRYANEPVSKTGDWVYTDRIKTFQLWKDINGKRVDTRSNNPDVLVDAYVNGSKAYILINNLELSDREFELNIAGTSMNPSSITLREMYGTGITRSDSCVVSESNLAEIPKALTLKREGTYVLILNYASNIVIDETLTEKKHYSDTYYEPIAANSQIVFNVAGITPSAYGEAILRIGLGRNHGLSLKPEVIFNGAKIIVPDNFRGYNQSPRDSYFGVIEIPVPMDMIKPSNAVSLKFGDTGGFVTSVTMQTFEFSSKIMRSDSVVSIELIPGNIEIGKTQQRTLTAIVTPIFAADKRVMWSSGNDAIATVDSLGVVTGINNGSTVITATTKDGGYSATCNVTVQTDFVTIQVDTVIVTPVAASIIEGDSLQLSYTVLPVDAANKTVVWNSTNSNISVSNTGMVYALSAGSSIATATGIQGKGGACNVSVTTRIPGKITIDKNYYSQVKAESSVQINCSFTITTGRTAMGAEFLLMLKDGDGTILKKYSAYDNSVKDLTAGNANASLSTRRLTPTNSLPQGQYYIFEILITESDGNKIIETVPVELTDPLGINDTDFTFNIFPNPADKYIILQGCGEKYTVEFYDMVGTLKLSAKIADERIDVSSLSDGAYIVVLNNNSNKAVTKLFIQH